jgi:holo-[acyl-carrier protein] synthase
MKNNMIIGIGIDLIAVERIQKACAKNGFLQRYFSDNEITLFEKHHMNPQKVAGNFCVKESVVKMFGTGFKGINLIDIEVLRDDWGKPYVVLHKGALKMQDNLKIDSIHVSISNTNDYVTAVAIGERLRQEFL